MNRPPAFQFYPKDWLDFRVQRMSLAAQGAYLKLLCFMWADSPNQCAIIDTNELLARAVGITVEQWLQLRAEIQCESDPIFEERNGHLVSARLGHEANKQRKYRKSQAQKGKRSAQQRFNRGSTVVQPECQPEGNSSSSFSLNSYRERKGSPDKVKLNGHGPSFEMFWAAYPKKEGSGACRRWWAKNNPDDVLFGVMLAKIEQAKQTPKWKDQAGKFIPMPATWLNQERWNDEYIAGVYDPITSNSHAPSRICGKRIQLTGDKFLRQCGQPASPQSRPNEPRCAEHLAQVSNRGATTHADR